MEIIDTTGGRSYSDTFPSRSELWSRSIMSCGAVSCGTVSCGTVDQINYDNNASVCRAHTRPSPSLLAAADDCQRRWKKSRRREKSPPTSLSSLGSSGALPTRIKRPLLFLLSDFRSSTMCSIDLYNISDNHTSRPSVQTQCKWIYRKTKTIFKVQHILSTMQRNLNFLIILGSCLRQTSHQA